MSWLILLQQLQKRSATSAFSLIKKGFDAGRDIESMYSDMGRWMGAVSDIRHADQMNKNPSVFKKLFNGSSIEEAMDIFAQEEGRRDGERITNICQSCLWGKQTHGQTY